MACTALVGLGPCEDEHAVAAARARRDALLKSTAPRADLFAQVERKGVAIERAAPVEARIAAARAEGERVQAEIVQLEAELPLIATRGRELEGADSQLRDRLAEATRKRAEAEEIVNGFARRHREREATR